MEEAKRHATRSISIRVPIADLEKAQEIAKKIGIGYETVLKQAGFEAGRLISLGSSLATEPPISRVADCRQPASHTDPVPP